MEDGQIINTNNLSKDNTSKINADKGFLTGYVNKTVIIIIVIVVFIIILISSGVVTINTGFTNNSTLYKNNSEHNEMDDTPLEKYIDIFMLKQDELMSK